MKEIPISIWAATIFAIVHMVACQLLINQIKDKYPAEYEIMGRPHVIKNNTPASTFLFWKWLLKKPSNLLERKIIRQIYAIRLVTLIFLLWFFYSIFMITSGSS
ncbi:hypothetical protein AVHM3334_06575 [Acidovorax sp. SUPP3334]|nr:hypothetical protein AVHM3334_06575 [Acidovorax sp. SUPP3334]